MAGLLFKIRGHDEDISKYEIINAKVLQDYEVKQYDGHNCGPMSCAFIWILMLSDRERQLFKNRIGLTSFGSKNLRAVIVNEMQSKLDHFQWGIKAFSKF